MAIMAAIPKAGTGVPASPTAVPSPELWLARPPELEGPAFRQRPLERSVRDALLARAGAAQGLAGPGPALSHSGSWVACGKGDSLGAGVDLEWLRPRAVLRLARFSYSADEAAWLAGLPLARRVGAFHELWVLKEAAAKALRLPLFTALAQCRFRLPEGEAPGEQSGPLSGQLAGQLSGELPGGVPWRAWLYAPRESLRLAWLAPETASPPPRLLEWQVGDADPRPADWPLVASGGG
jgi:hypothetical protein